MKISFYQRGNTIYSRVYDNNSMIRLSTGIKIPPHVKFLPSRESFAGNTPDVGELNVDLSRQRVILNQLFAKHGNLEKVKEEYTNPVVEYAEEVEGFMLNKLIDEYMNRIIAGKIKTKKEGRFKSSTISTYQFAQNTYNFFCAKHGSIDLKEIDLSGKDMNERKVVADKFASHFETLVNWMVDLEYSINTRADVVAYISFCVNYWSQELFLSLPKIKRPTGYEPPIVTLPEEFIKEFLNDSHNLYTKFKPEDKYMWEMVAVMLITSLRISDAVSLKPFDISFENGRVFLVKENQKTGTETTLPLPAMISEKVRFNIDNYGRVYSIEKSDSGWVRKRMSSFFANYKEMHQMYRYSRRNHLGQKIEVLGKFYDLVHPHMLRKTAITTMLSNGVSAQHVKFASGHSSSSQAFNRYVGFVEKKHKSEIENYYSKLSL